MRACDRRPLRGRPATWRSRDRPVSPPLIPTPPSWHPGGGAARARQAAWRSARPARAYLAVLQPGPFWSPRTRFWADPVSSCVVCRGRRHIGALCAGAGSRPRPFRQASSERGGVSCARAKFARSCSDRAGTHSDVRTSLEQLTTLRGRSEVMVLEQPAPRRWDTPLRYRGAPGSRSAASRAPAHIYRNEADVGDPRAYTLEGGSCRMPSHRFEPCASQRRRVETAASCGAPPQCAATPRPTSGEG